MNDSETNRFVSYPNKTIIALSLPAFLSMVAEPLTGLVDTAFVAQLGVVPLAALGIAVTALSSIFWIFNFLGIGTQTEVAQGLGRGAEEDVARATSLALLLSLLFGLLLLGFWPLLGFGARLLGASGAVEEAAVAYMEVRLFGAPTVLCLLTAFGALRGEQDMHSPLWIALGLNALNIVLDALLIFGLGPFPSLGIVGAALASTIAQWIGAGVGLATVIRRFGWSRRIHFYEATRFLKVGGDLFVRTGLLTLFLLFTTRLANQVSPESGAAHQAIRQIWLFTGMGLDALALTAQSLVGYFIGAGWVSQAKRVARLSIGWALGFGSLLALLMWISQDVVTKWFVPEGAVSVFEIAWLVAAAAQPIAAVAFATDGVHWGTGDYAFLRNAMLLSTTIGITLLLGIDMGHANVLALIWGVMGAWNLIRAGLGIVRIWPGIGNSPLSRIDTGVAPRVRADAA